MARPRKNDKQHIGEIYYVDPKHLVKPSNRNIYNSARNPNNKRPVMIGEQNTNKKVQISQMTTSIPTSKQVERHYVLELVDEISINGKKSYVDTRTISKSRLTNKKFKIGEDPLVKPDRRVSQKDLTRYQEARKRRYIGKR